VTLAMVLLFTAVIFSVTMCVSIHDARLRAHSEHCREIAARAHFDGSELETDEEAAARVLYLHECSKR